MGERSLSLLLPYSLLLTSWRIIRHLGLKNFAGLMVIRFLLGVSESVVTPGFVMYTSMFYTRREQVMRTMMWGCMQGVFTIVASLMSYGLGHITNTALRPWMYIYLVLGLLSVIVGVSWLVFMPQTPNTARFLTHDEQLVAVRRVASNMMGIKNYQWKYYQMWHAIKDVKTWLILIFVLFTMLPNGGLTSFGSLVISGLGFNPFQTLLIGLPSSIVSSGSMVAWGLISLKHGNLRTLGMAIPLLPAIAGISAVYATMNTDANKYGRVVAYWLINSYAVTVRALFISTTMSFSLLLLEAVFRFSPILPPALPSPSRCDPRADLEANKTVAVRPNHRRTKHLGPYKARLHQRHDAHHVLCGQHRRPLLFPQRGCTALRPRHRQYPRLLLLRSTMRHSAALLHAVGESTS